MSKQFQILNANLDNSTITIEYPVYKTTTIEIPRDDQGNLLKGMELSTAIDQIVNSLAPHQVVKPDDTAEQFINDQELNDASYAPRFTPVTGTTLV